MGFRVWGLGLGFRVWGLGLGFRVVGVRVVGGNEVEGVTKLGQQDEFWGLGSREGAARRLINPQPTTPEPLNHQNPCTIKPLNP